MTPPFGSVSVNVTLAPETFAPLCVTVAVIGIVAPFANGPGATDTVTSIGKGVGITVRLAEPDPADVPAEPGAEAVASTGFVDGNAEPGTVLSMLTAVVAPGAMVTID